MSRYLGIDIGGTTVKLGIVDASGQLITSTALDTKATSEDALAHELIMFAKPFTKELKALALAVPGPVSQDNNLLMLPNVAIDLKCVATILKSELAPRPVLFINDANAAALGEMWQGAAKETNSMVFITLGTGVGAGIISNQKLISGANGIAGEVGHLSANLSPDAPLCGCGKRGCLETYASATGVVRLYQQACKTLNETSTTLAGPSDSKAVFKAFAQNSPAAHTAISQACDYLGRALADIAAILNPEVFVLGGGMSAAYPQFIDLLTDTFTHYALPSLQNAPILKAKLGNNAGMIGAARFAMQRS